MTQEQSTTSRGAIIQINEKQTKDHLGKIVKGTIQETLDRLLNEEAARLCSG